MRPSIWHLRVGAFIEQPVVVHMLRTPCQPGLGLSSRDQHRAGRVELLSMPFETFERRTRISRRMLGGGFDPARDIAGITVNRWAHGYASTSRTMWDPDWPEDERPCVLARKPFGRIRNRELEHARLRVHRRGDRSGLEGGHRTRGKRLEHDNTLVGRSMPSG